MVIELNEANFEQITAGEGIALIDCWALWCRNCDAFGEAYAQAAARHPVHSFASLDTDAQKKIRRVLNIRHVPALLVFRDGLLLFKQPGSFDTAELDGIIEQTEGLDMGLVRSELAAGPSSSAA